ncbi:MAG: uracil-DNA glycosylase family protein [Verrucomicrobiae bacterium]|nr:uracil-DNA glycosylase family protein [Verrucomicrobiae bacterium]
MGTESFDLLLARVRACRDCEATLPLVPQPVLRASPEAQLLIVGQAPGRHAHETGVPWNDPSGDRLRSWLQMDRERFYGDPRIAIVPTGLCYPGRMPRRGGDAPPCPGCAPKWHPVLRAAMPRIRLTLLVGAYAQAFYLQRRVGRTLADTVAAGKNFLPQYFPLPHPSPRNIAWFRHHAWFEREIVPELRRQVRWALYPHRAGSAWA